MAGALLILCLAAAAGADKRVDASPIVAVDAGISHTLLLKDDGTVTVWGFTNYGRTPVPRGLSGVKAISAGGMHSAALREDGTVVVWGDNAMGQINIPKGLSGVTAVAAGGRHTLALKRDGTVVAWGSNESGQCRVPAGLSGVTAVSAGNESSVAIKKDGTIVVWGWGSRLPPKDAPPIKAIALGNFHTVALCADGTVLAWGENGNGQCNVPPGLSDVTAVYASAGYSAALKGDGTLLVWGGVPYGAPSRLSGVKSLAAGGEHVVVLLEDGTLAAWGNDNDGQLPPPADKVLAAEHDIVLAEIRSGPLLQADSIVSGEGQGIAPYSLDTLRDSFGKVTVLALSGRVISPSVVDVLDEGVDKDGVGMVLIRVSEKRGWVKSSEVYTGRKAVCVVIADGAAMYLSPVEGSDVKALLAGTTILLIDAPPPDAQYVHVVTTIEPEPGGPSPRTDGYVRRSDVSCRKEDVLPAASAPFWLNIVFMKGILQKYPYTVFKPMICRVMWAQAEAN